MTERHKNLIRDKEKIRKQKYRQNLKEKKLAQQICQSQATEPTFNTYKTPQSLRRAINGAARKLPYSPGKKAAVMKGLAKAVGFKIYEKTTPKASGKAISSELMEQVRNFFNCPDIVHTMPGMKDEITFWEKGVKTTEILPDHFLEKLMKYTVSQQITLTMLSFLSSVN